MMVAVEVALAVAVAGGGGGGGGGVGAGGGVGVAVGRSQYEEAYSGGRSIGSRRSAGSSSSSKR